MTPSATSAAGSRTAGVVHGRRLHRGREAQPAVEQHPGRVLPPEQGDARRRRAGHAEQPGQHHDHVVTIPEGLRVATSSTASSRRPASRRPFKKALGDPRRSGLPSMPTATPRVTSSRRPTLRARRRSRPTCSTRWSIAGGRPPRTRTSRPAPGAGLQPDEIMTIASLIEAEGRGSTASRSPASSTTASRRPQPGRPGYLQIDAAVN